MTIIECTPYMRVAYDPDQPHGKRINFNYIYPNEANHCCGVLIWIPEWWLGQ